MRTWGVRNKYFYKDCGKFEKCYQVDREIMILVLDRENHRFGREFGILNLGFHCISKFLITHPGETTNAMQKRRVKNNLSTKKNG